MRRSRPSPLATPTRTAFRLTGQDGAPLRGEVRTAGLRRPAVVILHGTAPIADRLALAGFTAVSCAPRADGDIAVVRAALAAGDMGVTPLAVGTATVAKGEFDLEWGAERVHVASLDEAVRWLAERIA